MQKETVNNYKRFYSAFNRLRIYGDREETKSALVLQYTGGRTSSLKEVTAAEYRALCIGIEGMLGNRDELKRRRSIALKLMQELEVDTTDWAQINDFCRHPRISGKAFGLLSIEELMELATKLRTIKRTGWRRKNPGPTPETSRERITCLINLASSGMTSYN